MGKALEIEIRLPLDRFSLSIEVASEAQVSGLFGPSGSGKTSLLEVVAGLRKAARGKVTFGDEVWQDSSRRIFRPTQKRLVGYVPQGNLLFPHWDVRRNLLAGERRARRLGPSHKATYEQVVKVLELGPLLARSTRDLSGGESQRVALGRALCSGARLLLLDEPMASLDSSLRLRIIDYLQRIKHEFGTRMIIVSHQPLDLLAICDEVYVLNAGKLQASGSPVEVLEQALTNGIEPLRSKSAL
ncbi:MAG: ATP-binding cassette domain-containing protein [Verrucomicrobiota bacterium JB022]|nr:ATP-binding cassette domain-containing protein [Verrucomicrobiota bacterium JB022]